MNNNRLLSLLLLLGAAAPVRAQYVGFGSASTKSLSVTAGGLALFSSGTLSVMGSVDYTGSPASLSGTTIINGDLRLRSGSTVTVAGTGKLFVYGNTYIQDGALVIEPGARVYFYGTQFGINPSINAAVTGASGGGTLALISPRPATGQTADGQQRPTASDGLPGGGGTQYVDGGGLTLGLNVEHRSATSLVLDDINGDGSANLALTGSLTLGVDNAPVVLGANTLALDQSAGTGLISGYSPLRYVQTGSSGLLRVSSLPAGGSFVFPVGNAATGDYTPLQLTNRQPAASAYAVRVTPTAPTSPAQPTAGRYWQLVADPAATFDLVLEHNLSTNQSGYDDQRAAVVGYDGSSWATPATYAAGTSPGTLSTTGPASGSSDLGQTGASGNSTYFTKVGYVAPLPVTLLEFTAQHLTGSPTVALAWKTASELYNAGFEVERSLNGTNWQQVGYVTGNGTTQVQHRYGLPTAYVGAAYYRLRQVDFNGVGTYSPVRTIGAEQAEAAFSVYPNPSGGELNVVGAVPDEPIRVLNAVGQVVAEFSGSELSQNLTGKLATGLYIVRQGKKQAHFTVK